MSQLNNFQLWYDGSAQANVGTSLLQRTNQTYSRGSPLLVGFENRLLIMMCSFETINDEPLHCIRELEELAVIVLF